MSKSELGALLKRLRRDAQMSEERIAVELEVTSKTVQNWEAGRTKASRATVLAYEKITGKTILDLRDGPSCWTTRDWFEGPIVDRRKRTRAVEILMTHNGSSGLLARAS